MGADSIPVATRTFRVTLDVTVRVQAIDEQLVATTKQRFHNPTLASDPSIEEEVARDRGLLVAVLSNAESLRAEVLRRVVWSLDEIYPSDDSLEQVKQQINSDLELVERLRDALPAEYYPFLHDVAEEGLLNDNTSFYQAAFTVEQSRVQIRALADAGSIHVDVEDCGDGDRGQ